MPLLYPGNIQDILDYGLLGIALSRFCGAWSSMKMVTNVCDSGGTVDIDPERLENGLKHRQRNKTYDQNIERTHASMHKHLVDDHLEKQR